MKKKSPAVKKTRPVRIVPAIQKIIARQLKKKPAQIALPAKLQADLGADSLDALEIVFQLEETFHIKIGEADANRMESVRDIVAYIQKKVKG